MKHIVRFAFLFVLSTCFATKIHSQTITTAVPFLLVTPDSRAGAMGETGVSTRPDVFSGYWNCSKLAFSEKRNGLGFSYTPWLRSLVPGMNLFYAGIYHKPDSLSAIGVSARYFSLGQILYINPSGAAVTHRPNEYAVDISYSRRLFRNFSFGITARYFVSDVIPPNVPGYHAAKSVAVDAGAFYQIPDLQLSGKISTVRIGAAVVNAGPRISYDSMIGDFIPTQLRIGSGIEIQADPMNAIGIQIELNKLMVPANGNYSGVSPSRAMILSFSDAPGGFREELREINLCAGVEYSFIKTFFIRAGYFYEDPAKGNRNYITLGGGINYSVIALDFAYLLPVNDQRSPLENTLRFSLAFNFDKLEIKPARRNTIPG
jgi:hypothetical protein